MIKVEERRRAALQSIRFDRSTSADSARRYAPTHVETRLLVIASVISIRSSEILVVSKRSKTFPIRMVRLFVQQNKDHALMMLDLEGNILAWLAGSENIFGYSSAEITGRSFETLFTPEDRMTKEPQKELSIGRRGGLAEDDRWMLRKDGGKFWASGVLQALRDEQGNIIGFGKVLRNRTDFRTQLETLSTRVSHLELADERKNHFISTLAHELRNPLQSLSNATQILRQLTKHEDGAFAIAIVERQMISMQRMVNDLLDIARISAGKMNLKLEEVSIKAIVEAAIETCRPLFEDRVRNLHIVLGDVPIYVRADSSRLQQVFVNLIENAAKYTDEGGEIWVKLVVDGSDALVIVQDNGIGISAEILPRIFELFTQAEELGNETRGGLGIGLCVVRDIVRLHGGSIQVRSNGLGKGSEFTVRLPLAHPEKSNRPGLPS